MSNKFNDCDYSITHQSSLRSHIYKKHKGINDIFNCPDCEKIFTDKSNMKRHVKSANMNKT